MKGIQDSSVDLSILKQLKIILILKFMVQNKPSCLSYNCNNEIFFMPLPGKTMEKRKTGN